MSELCECEREMTLREEIEQLNCTDECKKRLIGKLDKLIEELYEKDRYLSNCHRKIRSLEKSIVAVTEVLGATLYEIEEQR